MEKQEEEGEYFGNKSSIMEQIIDFSCDDKIFINKKVLFVSFLTSLQNYLILESLQLEKHIECSIEKFYEMQLLKMNFRYLSYLP